MEGSLRALMLVALLAAPAAGAQTIYKSTNPDGSVVYSDKPPADGRVDRIIEFPDLPNSPVPPLAVQALQSPGSGRARIAAKAPGIAVIMMHTPRGARFVQTVVVPSLEGPDPSQVSAPVDVVAPVHEYVQPPPPPVTLYSAAWCGYCRRAKAYLADHHIAYFNVDIDSEAGRGEFDNLGGGGIPLLTSGGKRIRGFKAEGYDRFFADR